MECGLIGAGAVGLGMASCLLQAGARLQIVARPAAARALRARGLGREGIFGAHSAPPSSFSVHEKIGALAGRRLDAILVCTKTFASEDVAAELGAIWERLPGAPPVVLCHNGWGSADLFRRRIPADCVYNARVITGFRLVEPTRAEITVHADAVHIGSLYGGAAERVAPLAAALRTGGLPTEVTRDIERDLWAKMLYNCSLNPLGALCGVPYGVLAERVSTRALLDTTVEEIFAVLDAAGLGTHWPDPGSYLRDFYAKILPPTRQHESSMLQDLRAGRRTEIDSLCGAVVELGAAHGVATPVNAALRQLVLAIEQKARG